MPAAERASWRLTLDAVAHYPRPGTSVPGSLAFSPDSRLLTYLFSDTGDLARALWAADTETGERRVLATPPRGGVTDANVNPEEALRRERQRVREGGITHFSWAKDADRILIPINGQLYVTSSAGGALRPVAPAAEPAVDARLTPDGTRVVFVRGRELWAADLAGAAPQQLTFDASDTVSNGLAEFIAQEEMGRSAGFWISPDGARVAYAQVDEGGIPVYPIVHQADVWQVEYHRYPFAGQANARIRVGVVSITGGTTQWLDLDGATDFYLARVDWRPDGRLVVQVERRDQRHLDLWDCNLATGTRTLLLSEDGDPWINLHNDLRLLADGTFVWSSERSGFRHLYLYPADGGPPRQFTGGDAPVDQLVFVDEARRLTYYLSGGGVPTERHLFRVPLDGGAPVRLTETPGFHGAVFAPDGSRYAHSFESRLQAPALEVVRMAAGEPSPTAPLVIQAPRSVGEIAPDLQVPHLVEVPTRDGAHLYGAIYSPAATDAGTTGDGAAQREPPAAGARKPPLVVSVYGGPHAQTVADTWSLTVDLRAQYLAAQGFMVFKLDNRGSPRRGLAFEGAIHRRLGHLEVQDQVDGVRWLVQQGLVDGERVGMYGWSYGGYMTLMALFTAPDVFRAGVAGAPVTDWDGYDTHYTERYMGTPADNPDGYRQSSALTHAHTLRGSLLVVHGMIDENVHFRHTARLVAALEEADRPFDLLVFPAERHLPRGEQGRRYLERRVVDFFARHLAARDQASG